MVKKGKYSYMIFGACLALGILIYILLPGKVHAINAAFDMAHGRDTVCCTLSIYEQNHKNGPSDYKICVKSTLNGSKKSLALQTLSRDMPCSMENYLGYANGFVWFNLREKPVLIYVFKQDSILDEKQSITLLNTVNPGTQLAFITYAPTGAVVYANLTNGEQMIIDPKTLHYVIPTTETESYNYGLLGKANLYRTQFDLNDSQQVILKNGSSSNVGFDLLKETYSVKNGFFDSLRTSEALVFTKFIAPYFSLLKGKIVLIQHRDIPGPESKPMISAFNLGSNQLLWTIPISVFSDSPTNPTVFDALNENYFYAVNTNKLFKINIKTGKLVS